MGCFDGELSRNQYQLKAYIVTALCKGLFFADDGTCHTEISRGCAARESWVLLCLCAKIDRDENVD
jgi:hypothetical protein